MSAPKWIITGTICLFSAIGTAAFLKKKSVVTEDPIAQDIVDQEIRTLSQEKIVYVPPSKNAASAPTDPSFVRPTYSPTGDFPQIDRIFQLFTTSGSKLPIVETINYSSSVSWLKGRPAWISDYAVYHNTSRHFIARSLNGRADYLTQAVLENGQFNVFRKDKNIQFHFLLDLSRCKMGFYYVDLDTNERVLLKTYTVGVGKLDSQTASGTLTPVGRFKLGDKVAIYQKETEGFYLGKKVDMMQVFGSRWMPLVPEGEEESAHEGYGLQGAPWVKDIQTGEWVESRSVVGAYDSDGCIRLCSEDIEEIFAIILTKPTLVTIVKDFHTAELPGIEVAAPSR